MSRRNSGEALVIDATGTRPSVQQAPPRTLLDLLARAREHRGVGLRFLDRRGRGDLVEWRSILHGAAGVAAGLASLGVAPGDRIALIYPTGVGFFHAFFGAQMAGAVPVPLYPPVRLGRLEEFHARTAAMLEAVSACLVLADGSVRRLLGPTLEKARPRLGCHALDDLSRGRFGASLGPDEARMQDLRVGVPLARVVEDDLALVQFSSGTTVAPKPVALSHRAVMAQVLGLNGFWPDEEAGEGLRHTGVSWLPLYHDMGLIGCIFPALERPSVMTLLGPEVFVVRPHLWLKAISDHRATISVAPNFAYGLCVDKIRDEDLEGVDLSSWRAALNGAEPVSPEVLRAFRRRFEPWGFRPEALTPVYGLSEATLAVSFSRLDRPFQSRRFDRQALASGHAVASEEGRELISVGRPLPGTVVEIRRPRGEAEAGLEGDAGDRRRGEPCVSGDGQNPAEVGQIWVRGPSLMDGYLDRPEATARALVDGWLDTGDLGFIQDGELFLVGRAKDLVLVRGRNHSPVELEQSVDGLPGARTGCTVAISYLPEGATREEVHLFVEHRKDATQDELRVLPTQVTEAVLAACGIRPDQVHVIEPGTLPRTSSGKLRRSETLARHLKQDLTAPEAVTPWHMAKALFRSARAERRSKKDPAPSSGASSDPGAPQGPSKEEPNEKPPTESG